MNFFQKLFVLGHIYPTKDFITAFQEAMRIRAKQDNLPPYRPEHMTTLVTYISAAPQKIVNFICSRPTLFAAVAETIKTAVDAAQETGRHIHTYKFFFNNEKEYLELPIDFQKEVIDWCLQQYQTTPLLTKDIDKLIELSGMKTGHFPGDPIPVTEVKISVDARPTFSSTEKNLDNIDKDTTLDEMIGLEKPKSQIRDIIMSHLLNQQRMGNHKSSESLHMAFLGNPGTGKTETARFVAQILHEAGILPTNKLIERKAGDLIGEYIGHTAPKVTAACNEAMGGVLFIDEAYILEKTRDFGPEAAAQLLQHMENERGKFIVIMAGYPDDMEKLIKLNPGFKSRIPYIVDFPDYTELELMKILVSMAGKKKLTLAPAAIELARQYFSYLKQTHPDEFANAREVRNSLQEMIDMQTRRLTKGNNGSLSESLYMARKFNQSGKIEGISSQDLHMILHVDVENFLIRKGITLPKPFAPPSREMK